MSGGWVHQMSRPWQLVFSLHENFCRVSSRRLLCSQRLVKNIRITHLIFWQKCECGNFMDSKGLTSKFLHGVSEEAGRCILSKVEAPDFLSVNNGPTAQLLLPTEQGWKSFTAGWAPDMPKAGTLTCSYGPGSLLGRRAVAFPEGA